MEVVGSDGTIPAVNRWRRMTRPYIPARATLYKGVRMRSRMEASFAQMLDADGIEWEYEPVCFADETGQYLPDFQMMWRDTDGNPCSVYVELKPYIDGPEDVARYKRRMEIVWSSEPDAQLLLMDMEGGTGYFGRANRGWRVMQPERRSDDLDEIADIFGVSP